MGKSSAVSYFYNGGGSTCVCVCECIHIQTLNLYRVFYTAIFLSTPQIHTKVQDQNILSPLSSLSDSTSLSVCYSFS